MTTSAMPYRPRLVESASIRRYCHNGTWSYSLHDHRSGAILQLEDEAATMLLQCDGTRDLGGILLATARAGAYRRAAAIEAQLQAFHARGLLEDGLGPAVARRGASSQRPLESLPNYRFSCSVTAGQGACCSTYPSYSVTPADKRRLNMAVDELAHRISLPSTDVLFLPMMGSEPTGLSCMAVVDGHCAWLSDDNTCSVHARDGASAKPTGCSVYPRCYVDDGTSVRVSPFVECGCVLASMGSNDGSALVAPDQRTAADLNAAVLVSELPPQLPIALDAVASRSEVRTWSTTVSEWLGEDVVDGVACAWTLARALKEGRLDELPARQWHGPSSTELTAALEQLGAHLVSQQERAAVWRSPHDRLRLGWSQLQQASDRLQKPSFLQRCLESRPSQAETFYLRALIFGHQWALGEQPLRLALMERALRMLLGRAVALTASSGPETSSTEVVQYPLALVEALLRGHGVLGFAVGLP